MKNANLSPTKNSKTKKVLQHEQNRGLYIIDTVQSLQTLVLPSEVGQDKKQLAFFLQNVTKTINKIIRGMQKLNNMTADQLVARPTYAEEFQNIRENVHKVVLNTSLADDWDECEQKANV